MIEWYQHAIVDTGRQPLFLILVAFVLTFVITRVVTRMIRAGIGPFKNVSAGGIHVHHVVPGIIAILVGGLVGFGASAFGFWLNFGAIVFGVGAALVLDEFAMILHLDDVYWKNEGRLSADVVLIACGVMACALVVAAPQDPPGPEETDPYVRVLTPIFFVLLVMMPIAVTILKGKVFVAAVSLLPFITWVSWFTAIRLAKPGSPWAKVFYERRPEKLDRSRARAARSAKRWNPLRKWFQDHVFGFKALTANPEDPAGLDPDIDPVSQKPSQSQH